MTSPEGQLKYFNQSTDQVITPKFKDKGLSQHHFETINTIHKGIIDYTSDMLNVLGNDIFTFNTGLKNTNNSSQQHTQFNANQTTELMALIVNRKVDIGELTKSLSVEDEFSGNQELNVLDFYDAKKESQH
jgi:hypothetical protein